MESNVWQEIEKRKALKDLVFDSIKESLKGLVSRIDLRNVGGKNSCVIVFKHNLALQEWKREESHTLEKMRTLYKGRNLKEIIVFHSVKAEVSHKPQPLEEKTPTKTYKEQSSGEFEIRVQDEKLRITFKAIQSAIKENLLKEKESQWN